ncbi:MAG: hypothetical protein HY22_07010 [[Candidatus Thermochlorobacteriaceae] bacterium GBChlB]|jgi:hypothetical protein|nr:MAG: hypothetical protein HY22_07010 [[Candidatus Thermochlorobacteriaceae] bacterium GBChlB]
MKKPILSLLLIVAVAVSVAFVAQQSPKQFYTIIGEDGSKTKKYFFRDAARGVGVAVVGQYEVIVKPLKNERVRLAAVRSVVELDLENKGTETMEIDISKLKLLSSTFLYISFKEFAARYKMEVPNKPDKITVAPGKGEKVYATFIADFADSTVIYPYDYPGAYKVGNTEDLVLLWNRAVKVSKDTLALQPIRFKPE